MNSIDTDKYELRLCKATKITFHQEHGCLSFFVQLHHEEGYHQAFGGYQLDEVYKGKKRMSIYGYRLLENLAQLFDVKNFCWKESIEVNKIMYAIYEKPNKWNATIIGLSRLNMDSKPEQVNYLLMPEFNLEYL